jgi:hypothetical protein
MKTLEQLTARTDKKIKNRRQSMLVRSQQELRLDELSQFETSTSVLE